MTKIDPTVTITKCVLLLAVQNYNAADIFNIFKQVQTREYIIVPTMYLKGLKMLKMNHDFKTQIYKCSKHMMG